MSFSFTIFTPLLASTLFFSQIFGSLLFFFFVFFGRILRKGDLSAIFSPRILVSFQMGNVNRGYLLWLPLRKFIYIFFFFVPLALFSSTKYLRNRNHIFFSYLNWREEFSFGLFKIDTYAYFWWLYIAVNFGNSCWKRIDLVPKKIHFVSFEYTWGGWRRILIKTQPCEKKRGF